MCGLIAAWSPFGFDRSTFKAALDDLYHRGPDACDSLFLANGQVYLAHARLKIIDTSNNANQPFVSPCGRYVLVYNGEVYNYRELKAEIGSRWNWKTNSDTEVILAAWSIWGAESLQRFVGMFAFALYDAIRETLTVVRDRFGIKPLYFTQQHGNWYFASEIPPLLRFVSSVKEDRSAIRTYLELGLYDHSAHTFFDGVKCVRPSEIIELDLVTGRQTSRDWYVLSKSIPDLSGATPSELIDACEQLILQAVSSHLIADVAVGLNVSGGTDSAMLIRAAVNELGHVHLFNQDYAQYSELPWINEIIDGCSLHTTKLNADNIGEYLSATVMHQAEPFGGVFVCGYNALYEAACRENITVLLDGNGVDEAFLGYKKYQQIYVAASRNAKEFEERVSHFIGFWGHKPSPVVSGASIDGTAALHPEVLAAQMQDVDLILAPERLFFLDPVRQAAAEDLHFSKIPRGLRFNDRVSMAHSRELRVPFLDHRLVEFAFGLPIGMLINGRGGKAIFRDVLRRYVPDSIAYAKKRSIQSPQREWLGGAWRHLIEDVLGSESFAGRGWIDPGYAKRVYEEYLQGDRENSFFVWQWLNLELWARSRLDKVS